MIDIAPDRDPLVRWALRAPGARVWRQAGAVVVACADLSHWDRLVINGEPEMVAGLLRQVLAETGETFRPFGTEELVTEVVARVPELEVSATFAWMERTGPVRRADAGPNGRDGSANDTAGTDERTGAGHAAGRAGAGYAGGRAGAGHAAGRPGMDDGVGCAGAGNGAGPLGERDGAGEKGEPAGAGVGPVWLEEGDWPAVTAMIEESYPESYAWPGNPGVRRWAGIRDARGELLTVAAEAWSTPEIGFMSGVATRPSARGRGLGAAICAFVADELLAGRERVALLVDHWNTAALATYTRLGFATRRVAAARRR